MGVFDRSLNAAQRLIRKYGQDVTWQKRIDGVPADPAKPWLPAEVAVNSFNVRMVFFPEKSDALAVAMLLRGTEVHSGALVGIMAAGITFVPDIKDTVLRDGMMLAIESINLLAPNGNAI